MDPTIERSGLPRTFPCPIHTCSAAWATESARDSHVLRCHPNANEARQAAWSLDDRMRMAFWKGSPGGGDSTTQPVHGDIPSRHESWNCLSGRISRHVSDAPARDVNYKQQAHVWSRLPSDVKQRLFALLAYKPDLCRLAAVCGGDCFSLRGYATKTIFAPSDLPLGGRTMLGLLRCMENMYSLMPTSIVCARART
jgi:hypothetical protein